MLHITTLAVVLALAQHLIGRPAPRSDLIQTPSARLLQSSGVSYTKNRKFNHSNAIHWHRSGPAYAPIPPPAPPGHVPTYSKLHHHEPTTSFLPEGVFESKGPRLAQSQDMGLPEAAFSLTQPNHNPDPDPDPDPDPNPNPNLNLNPKPNPNTA